MDDVLRAQERADVTDDDAAVAESARVSVSRDAQREALEALRALDEEMAAAYQAAADVVGEALREQLLSFRGDHLRHVAELGGAIVAHGGKPDTIGGASPATLMARLAMVAGSVAPEAAVLSLLADEEVSTAAYETALYLALGDQATALLERNRADEQRHFEWLQARLRDLATSPG